MPPGLLRFITLLAALLILMTPFSCVKVRGPGIIPPVDENGVGEWVVRYMGHRTITTTSGDSTRQWSILARFSPEEASRGLTALDITVALDGEPIPFTFEEDEQILESAVPSRLTSGVHEFLISPSQGAVHPFPTLRVRFEAP